jgi:WD40 repeat protein
LIYRDDGGPLILATPPGYSIIEITGDEDVGLLASVGIGSATIFWSLQTGQPVSKIDDEESLGATRALFSPGSQGWVARADVNQSLSIWPWPKTGLPASTGPATKRLEGHKGLVIRLRATPDGRLLSESLDKTAILWDPRSGRMLARYTGVGTTALSADGHRLIILGTDGAVRVATMPPSGQELLDAMSRHGGALLQVERNRYFLN